MIGWYFQTSGRPLLCDLWTRKVFYPLGLILLTSLSQVCPEPFSIEINRKIRPFLKTLDKKKKKAKTPQMHSFCFVFYGLNKAGKDERIHIYIERFLTK